MFGKLQFVDFFAINLHSNVKSTKRGDFELANSHWNFENPFRIAQTSPISAEILTQKTMRITFAILGGTLLLIGIIVSIYGHRLAGKIKSLTDVAERISIGDLGIEVETKSRDEIGELAEKIRENL